MRPTDPQIFFPAAGGAGAADILIEPQSSADDRGIPAPSGDLESHAAGGGYRRHFALFVERDAIDGAVRWMLRHVVSPRESLFVVPRKIPFQIGHFGRLVRS